MFFLAILYAHAASITNSIRGRVFQSIFLQYIPSFFKFV